MIDTIFQAAKNFCNHQITLPYTTNNELAKNKTIITYIDINTKSSRKYRIYIAGENRFIQRVSKVFLEEDESDENTLIDMTLETANLIVGSAKVIAENENPFTIDTPHFIKVGYFNFDYDEIKIIKVQDDNLLIAIKEID